MFEESARDREALTEERRRRLVFLRMGMLLCLLLVLMDSNPPRSSPGRERPVSAPSEDFERITFSPEIEAKITALKPPATLISKQNITGLYRGSVNGDRALFHLSSVGITHVPWLSYVYGVGKTYHLSRDSPRSTLYPVQGFIVSLDDYSAVITAFANPFVNRKLALEIDEGFSGANSRGNISKASYTQVPDQSGAPPLQISSRPIEYNSSRLHPLVINITGAPGLRMVSFASVLDLEGLSLSSGLRTSQKFYQLISEETLPANFRPLIYPKFGVESCDYTMEVTVSFDENALTLGETSYASEIIGEAKSLECPAMWMNLQSTRLTAELLDRKINAYVTLALLVCLAQIGFFVVQLRYSSASGTLGKISILCLSSQALLDSILCVAHLMLCAAFSKHSIPFLSVAALELLLFSVFGMRCVIGVYQTRHAQEFIREGISDLRRRLAFLQARFCVSLFGVMILIYSFSFHPFLLMILFSVWVPQIIWNAVAGTRLGLSYVYLLGTGLSRLILPLYVMCCPQNMFAILFDGLLYAPATCVGLVVWTTLQIGVLITQDLFGPRYFVPKFLLPARYDYFRPISHGLISPNVENVDVEHGLLPECVICYCVVDGEHMITPCDHVFHKHCLSRWMEVKLECPVCRASLPPLE